MAAAVTITADWFTGGEFSSQTRSAIQGVPILGTIFNMLTGIPLIGGILEDVILPFAKIGMEAWQAFTDPVQFGKDLANGFQFLFSEGLEKVGSLILGLPGMLWSAGKSVLSGLLDLGGLVTQITGTLLSIPVKFLEGLSKALSDIPFIGPVFSGLANILGPLGDFLDSPLSSLGSILSSTVPSPSDIGSAVVSGLSFLRGLRAQFIDFMTRIPTMIPQAILSGLSGLAGMFGLTGVQNTLNSISQGIESVRSTVANMLTNPIGFIFDGLMAFWDSIKGSIPFVGGPEQTESEQRANQASSGLGTALTGQRQIRNVLSGEAEGGTLSQAASLAGGSGRILGGLAQSAADETGDILTWSEDETQMAKGGVIREPVSGVTASGRKVQIAESGPEAVVPIPENGSGQVEPGGGPLSSVLSNAVSGIGNFVRESTGLFGSLASKGLGEALGVRIHRARTAPPVAAGPHHSRTAGARLRG
jgi:hypothetical protein